MAQGPNLNVAPDRFIRGRSTINFELLSDDRSPIQTKNSEDDNYFKNTAKEKNCLQNYQNALLSASGKAVFNNSNRSQKERCTNIPSIYQWPVQFRKKPCLPEAPYIVLDMPDLHRVDGRNMVDWSCLDYIATTYKGDVYIWNAKEKTGSMISDINIGVTNCIKWNRAGTLLAVSLAIERFAVYDFCARDFKYFASSCPCNKNMENKVASRPCVIISIEWTKYDQIISGCSKGTLSFWSANLKLIHSRIHAHYSQIHKMALSCNDKYLATSGADKVVLIWTFPELVAIQSIKLSIPTKAICWHPWQETLLAVAEIQKFYLINVQSKRKIGTQQFIGCIINNLSFNPKSAELLLSVYHVNEKVTYLKVMKNMDTVVDEVRFNEHNILYLLWDSTGTKLGTASTDENFCIWTFFGNDTELEKKFMNTSAKMFSLDPVKTLFLFRETIR